MFKVVRFLFGHKPWTPFRVLNSGFEVIKNDVLLEKEHLEDFRKGVYYPINIGDVFASSYQVVGKLGFGTTSTVWLARDMQYAQISYPANIWNIWDIYDDKHFFCGIHPVEKGYLTRAHFAEVVAMLGAPPLKMLTRGKPSKELFDDEGNCIADRPVPDGLTLDCSEENLAGKGKEAFLEFLRCMLQWRPNDRMTAKQSLVHSWLGDAR